MTPDDAARIQQLRQTGLTWRQVADRLDVTPETLRVWRHALGLPVDRKHGNVPRPSKTRRMIEVETLYGQPLPALMRDLTRSGATRGELADLLGVSCYTAIVWRKRLGVILPDEQPRRKPKGA